MTGSDLSMVLSHVLGKRLTYAELTGKVGTTNKLIPDGMNASSVPRIGRFLSLPLFCGFFFIQLRFNHTMWNLN
jgi:hypothetical protein